ncbi:MAG TPA: heme-binding domain-containing protein [Panacibacter sp.]|nr:heme-binding domain-containing protein [Panacibacter sp.]
MSKRKMTLLILLILFVAIQFIRPTKNINGIVTASRFSNLYNPPASIDNILQMACYDCHSNNTRYPWYANIQPAGWILQSHITKGKSELNFDEFATYSARRKLSKLKSIISQVNDGEMPLQSYTWIHKDARLSDEQKKILLTWVKKTMDSLTAKQ